MIAYGGGKSGRIHRNVQPTVQPTKPKKSKKCTKCGEEKPLGEFNRNGATRDGFETRCRACTLEAKRARTGSKPREAQPVIVDDLEKGETTEYASTGEAAKAIGCANWTIHNMCRKPGKKPIYGRYVTRYKETA